MTFFVSSTQWPYHGILMLIMKHFLNRLNDNMWMYLNKDANGFGYEVCKVLEGLFHLCSIAICITYQAIVFQLFPPKLCMFRGTGSLRHSTYSRINPPVSSQQNILLGEHTWSEGVTTGTVLSCHWLLSSLSESWLPRDE